MVRKSTDTERSVLTRSEDHRQVCRIVTECRALPRVTGGIPAAIFIQNGAAVASPSRPVTNPALAAETPGADAAASPRRAAPVDLALSRPSDRGPAAGGPALGGAGLGGPQLGGPPLSSQELDALDFDADAPDAPDASDAPDAAPAPARVRRRRPPQHLADLDAAGRRAAVTGLGQPAFRADQLSRHYFARLTEDPAQMTDLPAGLRTELTAALLPQLLTAERELTCDGGTTRKTLWSTLDGALVESVLMRYPDRVTMCVSSQAGCGMACPFCATGQAGLTRNLSTAEIVGQVVAGARELARGHVPGGPGRVSNVVFMGMGEPLANYASVLAAVRRITDPAPDGLGISQRSVTVSTVGLVPAIRRLSAEKLSVRLAVSLHAPDDELRDELVPVNRRWKIAEVLDAAWGYADATGRRVSIEYAMIRDVNDHAWRADALAGLLAGRLAHVNLIPLNPTPGSRWTASDPDVAQEFVDRIADRGIPVTVRDTRGTEIDGACGQLAAATR
jgi:23S rRNA (adenine2503-C2)-methyltransferase